MALECPKGWTMVDAPSLPSPDKFALALPDQKAPLSGVKYTERVRKGFYEWEIAKGVIPVQGLCHQKMTFTGGFSIEKSSEQTLNIGTLFNLPGVGEAIEVSGGYSYTWGSTDVAGSGIEITVGEQFWEYLVQPVVLKFTVEEHWKRTGIPWYEWAGVKATETLWNASMGDSAQFDIPLSGITKAKPLFVRGALMICRRPCGLPEVGGEVGVETESE